MHGKLSATGVEGLRKRLDEAQVLQETVAQLRKDLNDEGILLPPTDEKAFEMLRAAVLHLMEGWQRSGSTAFSRAINRVDLTEPMVDDAIARGGTHELAGMMVLHCLQKVLSRKRFAGKF